MTATLAEIFNQIKPDPWREQVGFSESVEGAHRDNRDNRDIFTVSQAEAATRLNAWIQKHQPCVFGRIAARFGLIQYCILTEHDIQSGDETIQEKIQASRLSWLQNASKGEQSGFVIALISRQLAYGLPDSAMGEFARRLASLYLLEPVAFDTIYLESIELEIPGRTSRVLVWDAGVNYFAANADGRWWQDHRIPGGVAFSVNSVGHMVRSARLSRALKALDDNVGLSPDEEEMSLSKVDSLGKALELAMKTISLASNGPSGPATRLLPISGDTLRKCPIDLRPPLSGFNFSEYLGYYHTDNTLPLDYFHPAVERPVDAEPYNLDFTYLFDNSLDNPDFLRMGEGRRIRSAGFGGPPLEERTRKRRKAAPEERDEQYLEEIPIRGDLAR
ncbi:MAG: hypothetical protein QOF89_4414 [Acidobacteriota bacterium]|jgi:hypothetical protein|nr:hypothetical protein [Acidobacteriota bacterium]